MDEPAVLGSQNRIPSLGSYPRDHFLDLLANVCQYALDFDESNDAGLEPLWKFALCKKPPHLHPQGPTMDAQQQLAKFLKESVIQGSYKTPGSIIDKLYNLDGNWLASIPLSKLRQGEMIKLTNHKDRAIRYAVADRATALGHALLIIKLMGDPDEEVAKLAAFKMTTSLFVHHLITGNAIRLPSNQDWLV